MSQPIWFYLLSFSSAGFYFRLFQNSVYSFCAQNFVPGCSKTLIAIDVNRFLSFNLRAQISLPCNTMGRVSALYIFILENFWTKVSLKLLFRTPSIWANFASKLRKFYQRQQKYILSRDSSVGIATCCRLDGSGIESWWWAKFSAPLQRSRGVHPTSCPVGTGSLSWG